MTHDSAGHHRSAILEVMSHARLIAGGLAALGMSQDEAVAILLHNDPVYLSVIHACRIAGCRIRQVSPHSTREQIASVLNEPGIRAAFMHDYFLTVLAPPPERVALIAVTPLSLFPGSAPAARAALPHQPYHLWLMQQEERTTPLRARRGRSRASDCAAVSARAVADCAAMLSALISGSGDSPPRADAA